MSDVRAVAVRQGGRAKRIGSRWFVGLALLVAATASARDYVEANFVVSATTTFTVLPPNRKPPEEPAPVAGDVNGDGGINIVDLVTVASAFGSSGANLPADVNGDGVVNIVDLVFVASRFGSASPSATVDGSLARQIAAWLSEARSVASSGPSYRRGIEALESLLATYRAGETALLPAYPNPFNPEVWIPYRLAEPSSVVITIYGSDGSLVRRLEIGVRRSGDHAAPERAAHWDGRNEYGELVGSGVYFVEIVAGSFRGMCSILLSKLDFTHLTDAWKAARRKVFWESGLFCMSYRDRDMRKIETPIRRICAVTKSTFQRNG